MAVDSAPRHVVLVGEMGTGKTTVGMVLASRLDVGFADSDEMIERITGSTGAQIVGKSGVDALHALELEALEAMIALPTASVIAPAASVIDTTEGRRILGSHTVVWLTTAPDVVSGRLHGPDHRRSTTPEERAELLARRTAFYADVADLRVDTGHLEPAQAADRIVTWLEQESI